MNGGCVAFDVASDEHVRMENYVAPEKSIMTTVTGGGTVQIDGLQSGVYKLGAREGGLVVSNASGIVLRDVQIDSAAAGGLAGEMRIANCSDITLEPTNGAVVRVGHATTAGDVPARLTISGSTLQSWSVLNGDEAAYGSDCTDKAIVVGGAGAGILEILDGTAMTNRVVIGGDSNFARGAMYVRGGHFGSYGSTGDSGFNSGVGQGTSGYCYGYLEVSGGEYRMLGGHSIAATGQSGVMCVKGNGRVTMDRRQGNRDWVPSFNIPYNGQAVINVSGGGTVNLNPCNILTCRGGSASRLVLTSEGEGSLFSVQNMLICGYAANTVSILNAVDGGVIAYPYLGKNQVGAKCYFNFNGGTCRSLANYFLFGRQEGRTVGHASGHQIDKVTVFEKGATIEVQNASHTSYIEELLRPSGKGVVAVATGDLGTKSVVGSPIVVIEGDGWGASAYADFDSVAGRISGIHVTSPGCDYTHATAKVMYGATVLAENLEVTLADNVGGSFTKTGPGTLEVYGTNTYAGATIIKAGKLVARSDRTFPEGTDLVLEGGTVDFCERDYRFGKVSGTGGTIINGTASMGGVEWTVDCADLVAGRYESFPSFVSVLPGTTVRFVNTHLLTEGVRYQVYAFPNGAPGGLGNIEFEAPNGWHCTRSSTGVKLSVDCGLMLIVR